MSAKRSIVLFFVIVSICNLFVISKCQYTITTKTEHLMPIQVPKGEGEGVTVPVQLPIYPSVDPPPHMSILTASAAPGMTHVIFPDQLHQSANRYQHQLVSHQRPSINEYFISNLHPVHQSNHGHHQSNHGHHQSNHGHHQSNHGHHQSNHGHHQTGPVLHSDRLGPSPPERPSFPEMPSLDTYDRRPSYDRGSNTNTYDRSPSYDGGSNTNTYDRSPSYDGGSNTNTYDGPSVGNTYDSPSVGNQDESENGINQINSQKSSSDCALVLQRTYVRKSRVKSHPPSYFDIMKNPYSRHSSNGGPHEELCIRYIDVNRAVQMAKHRRRYQRPAGIRSLEPPIPDIDTTGELTLMTTRILAEKYKLSPAEILNGLSLIDMSRTLLWDECPDHVKPIPCTVERYRTYTAHCNNLKNPSWGSAFTPFVRYLPPVYGDGIDVPRVSVVDGSPLPSPRLVTTLVHRDHDHHHTELTILIMSWGQFIDHDLTLAAPPKDAQGDDFNCCDMPSNDHHPNCLTIDIPRDDYFFSRFGRTCMEFKRSLSGQRPHCALGPRVHVNQLTSPIDANFVYGSDEKLARKLRSFVGGKLRVWDRFSDYHLKALLPPESENPDRDCTARPRHLFCFIAGDERVNEQIHLTILHTLYVRAHNKMTSELSVVNPHWDDEKLYQETRHIMAAIVQHTTISEYLPLLLGQEMIMRYNLTEAPHGQYWDGYDPHVHMGPSHAFQSAAFRFGHTFIQGMVRRYNKWHEFIGEDPLRNLLRQPFIVYEPGKIDELIGGLINTPSQKYDPFITREVSNHLFEQPNDGFGMDLPALNLQRGREHAVPGYNIWREWCGLPRAHNFDDLEPFLQNGTAHKYSLLYKHPDDIDLWSGGISEHKLPGAIIGPTFACIIARQFSNIRRGDRFWFENSGWPSSFTPDQLVEIKKMTTAKIICENGDDIPTIQRYVLKMPHPIYNPRIRCEELPWIDLRYWKEEPQHSSPGHFF